MLLFCPLSMYAQLSDDALKSICKSLYDSTLQDDTELNPPRSNWSYHILPVEEVFSGYFDSIRVFLVTCRHSLMIDSTWIAFDHSPTSFRLYALIPQTGKEIEVSSIEEFNSIFAESSKLCNLDKCYLYLLLATKQPGNLTNPGKYRKALSNASVFLRDTIPHYTYHSFGVLYTADEVNRRLMINPQIDRDISQSTKNNIYIYSESENGTYRYEFIYTSKGILKEVKKAELKL